ncbi:MAG: hypothetical protein SGI89_03140 [bacterium]|nr:hypothetical protein [bacterium]
MRHNLLKRVFYIFLSMSFFSCGKKAEEITDIIKGKPENLNLICFIDFSQSIPESTKEDYKNIILGDIIPALGAKDKIVILPIDYGTQTGSKEIFSANFADREYVSKMSPLNEKPAKEKANLKLRKDSLIMNLTENYSNISKEREKYSHGTDIFGALQTATQYLDNDMNNLILFFSDMEQSDGKINMEKELSIDKNIEKLIKKSPSTELKHSEIIVYTGEQPNLTIDKYKSYKNFWSRYFEKYSIKLISYDSGSKSVLQDKLKASQNK